MRPLCAVLLFATCLCRAENACPWLNAATAAGILGGPVKENVTKETCEFTGDQSTLRIEVKKQPAPLAMCASKGTPLKGIGNQAELCSSGTWIFGGYQTTTVVGRVRNQRFRVTISTSDPAILPTAMERTRKAAEQVAGSLY